MMKMGLVLMMVVVLITMSNHEVEAQQVHHVIGGARGGDSYADVDSWSHDKVFRVGDNIWFAYSNGQELVTELRSKEEFEACDISNPIKMYTDGVDRVVLNSEGSRYFVSGTTEKCKNGLKLHVHVMPKQQPIVTENSDVVAAGPTPTSTSAVPVQVSTLFWVGLSLYLFHLVF